MTPKLTIRDVEILLDRMKKAQNEHPTAEIKYDTELTEVLITYPLHRQSFESSSVWKDPN